MKLKTFDGTAQILGTEREVKYDGAFFSIACSVPSDVNKLLALIEAPEKIAEKIEAVRAVLVAPVKTEATNGAQPEAAPVRRVVREVPPEPVAGPKLVSSHIPGFVKPAAKPRPDPSQIFDTPDEGRADLAGQSLEPAAEPQTLVRKPRTPKAVAPPEPEPTASAKLTNGDGNPEWGIDDLSDEILSPTTPLGEVLKYFQQRGAHTADMIVKACRVYMERVPTLMRIAKQHPDFDGRIKRTCVSLGLGVEP